MNKAIDTYLEWNMPLHYDNYKFHFDEEENILYMKLPLLQPIGGGQVPKYKKYYVTFEEVEDGEEQ